MIGGAAVATADTGQGASGSAHADSSDAASDSSTADAGPVSGAKRQDRPDGFTRHRVSVRTAEKPADSDETPVVRRKRSATSSAPSSLTGISSTEPDASTDTKDASDAGAQTSTRDSEASTDVDPSTTPTDDDAVSPTDDSEVDADSDTAVESEATTPPVTTGTDAPADSTSTSTPGQAPTTDDSPAIETSPDVPAILESAHSGAENPTAVTRGDATNHTASTVNTNTLATAASPAIAPAAVATAARTPFGLPTPSQLLRGLQELGTNLYITAMNQMYGLQRSLTLLRNDVRSILGFTQQVITRALPFGNPAGNVQYFVSGNDFLSAALATVAMAYGQLTHTVPDLQGFLDAAADTDSITVLGTKVYLGPGVRIVYWQDSYEVLQDKDVRIIMRNYGADQWSKAFNDLTNGLQDPTKVMIVPITGPVSGRTDLIGKTVVVLGVDNVNGTVTVNDPTRVDGQGLTMDRDDFMEAWAGQRYQLITTQLASSPNAAPATAKTKWVWSLPSPQRIVSGVAAAFVHQIQSFQESITDLSDDLSRTFGVSQPEPIGPPGIGDVEYGNYLANYQYWKYQGNFGTCALMATAAVIAQLTGNGMPVDMVALAKEVQTLAETLPSGIKVGQPIYTEGLGGTYSSDVITLLNKFGINADYTTYLKTEGALALDNMTAALSQNQSVIVSVNNKLIYDAWNKQYFGDDWAWYEGSTDKPNHAVTVLSVNMTKGVVYINDSAPKQGQGLAVPLDQFMKAWETGSFALTTAERGSGAAG